MNDAQLPDLDPETFRRVWRRVMPEDRADCPFVLNDPTPGAQTMAPVPPQAPRAQAPAVCLGQSSQDALPALEGLLTLTADAYRIYRALGRRMRRRSLPAALAADKARQLRRLTTAHFLISGERFSPPPTEAPSMEDLPLALRERYQAEQQTALAFLSAASSSADPCLLELYRALATENQTHAGQLREWLERM